MRFLVGSNFDTLCFSELQVLLWCPSLPPLVHNISAQQDQLERSNKEDEGEHTR